MGDDGWNGTIGSGTSCGKFALEFLVCVAGMIALVVAAFS